MRVCGVIAEYNPFHNGHLYHLKMTREAGYDGIIAVMSPNFTQRGEAALLSKFRRAAMAAECGADLVIELPVSCALSSAERFAASSVHLLSSLGVADGLSFGSECGDIGLLRRAAQAAADPETAALVRKAVKSGLSHFTAQRQAVAARYGEEVAALSDSPNNLLGIEYLKALSSENPDIVPMTVPRSGAGHDSMHAAGETASASLIRNLVLTGGDYRPYLPAPCADILGEDLQNGSVSEGLSSVERLVLWRLRELHGESFSGIPDCRDGLGDRIRKAAAVSASLQELYERSVTKRYPLARVRRAVLGALLGIGPDTAEKTPYARVLAAGRHGKELMSRISRQSPLPVCASLRGLEGLGGDCKTAAGIERSATELWSVTRRTVGRAAADDVTRLYTGRRDNK